MEKETETIIIGGGRAGLSVARYLKEFNRSFVILEKNKEIGESWKNRYDSLVLDSFAKYSHLESFPFPGDQMRQPQKDDVVFYLKNFAKHFDLKPEFGTKVIKIEKQEETFIIHTNKGIYKSKFLVLATGPFQTPFVPEFAKDIPKEIFQLHSDNYRNPHQLKDGPTVVIGGGNSGAEIAEEIANSGREVLFSYKRKFRSVKSSHFSQWLAYSVGLAHVPQNTLLGKLILWYTKGKAVGIDVKKLLNHPKIKSVGEFIKAENDKIHFSKVIVKNISNIIWATGYRSDFSIISIPDFDPSLQKRGVTNIPGLFVLNIRWQHSKSSSHLAGISRDAKYIAQKIANNQK